MLRRFLVTDTAGVHPRPGERVVRIGEGGIEPALELVSAAPAQVRVVLREPLEFLVGLAQYEGVGAAAA